MFAVGLDTTDPAFPDGSATLFSGDDEFYGAITGPFDANILQDMGRVLDQAIGRLNVIAPGPKEGGSRRSRRIASRHVWDAAANQIAPAEFGGHPGILPQEVRSHP